jgi:hypothetical protein
LVNAVITANAENLTDEIWSPAKLLSLGIDYNGVNPRFVPAETLAGMLLKTVAEDLEPRRIWKQSGSVWKNLATLLFKGGTGHVGGGP